LPRRGLHRPPIGRRSRGSAAGRKTVDRTIAEVKELRERHGITSFVASDNILDEKSVLKYSKQLASELPDVRIFYDVRATLTRDEMKAMARGGIDELEAGLESLSTPILKRMGKGATGINNVRFLRRCREFGITPLWNYLFAFPNEAYAEYAEAAARIAPWLHHLAPPDVAFPLSLQRFSPYYDEQATAHGIRVTGPVQDYRYIHGRVLSELEDLAYYFSFEYLDGYDPGPTGSLIADVVAMWQDVHRRGAQLAARADPGGMIVVDARKGRVETYQLGPAGAFIYRLCESPQLERDLPSLVRRVSPSTYLRHSGDWPRAVAQMRNLGLFYEERGRLLAVAVPERDDFWIAPLPGVAASQAAAAE
jgi:Radical SAM superfamily